MDIESFRPDLEAAAQALGWPLGPEQVDRLLGFLALLQRWNSTYNLTAIRDPRQMLSQHLVDCLAVCAPLRAQAKAKSLRIGDIGSGGGLPGAVLAIAEPGWHVTCVDSVGKKAAFVQQVAAELGLRNLHARHSRAERLSVDFDLVISRAFASLADFVKCTRQAMGDAGVWMAMKGKMPDDEITSLPNDIEVFHVEQLEVPGLNAERCLVWLRRRPTPA